MTNRLQSTPGSRLDTTSRARRLLISMCPHWWWQSPHHPEPVLFEVERVEYCKLCGKQRLYARMPLPHPSRDKEALLDDLQGPNCELIVTEWWPYEEGLEYDE